MAKVVGSSDNDDGVLGTTTAHDKNAIGALNTSTSPAVFPGGNALFGVTTTPSGNGVFGANNSPTKGRGVQGNGPEAGVGGFSQNGSGVLAQSGGGPGLLAQSNTGAAIRAESASGDGVSAQAGAVNRNAVFATNTATTDAAFPGGNAVFGVTTAPGGNGVFGSNNSTTKGRGVQGNGPEAGVGGFSDAGSGVLAQSRSGIGLLAQGGHLAARFEGDVEITGDIKLMHGDCAEEFGVIDSTLAEPGTVMIVDESGTLRPSMREYDTRVAGIVSGAGLYQPALTLDHRSDSVEPRCAIALMGKVYCKVDAGPSPIRVGDLLTTSPSAGYAMRASDKARAFGAVIGKALQPIASGRGLVAVLVALQ